MDFQNYEQLTFDLLEGGILKITLDRPEKYLSLIHI